MRSVIAAALATALTFPGCQRSEGRYLERSVTAGEVIGTWVMNPTSVKDLRDVGYTHPLDPAKQRMIFLPDGTCTFGTITPTAVREGSAAAVSELPCRWRIDSVNHQAVVIDVASDPPSHAHYFFDETKDRRLQLWQYVDDPDAWRYVEYLRQ